MKKYVFKRVLRSLFSLFMVTTLIYSIIYTMVPRKKIFEKDATYTKMAKDPDSKTDYVNTVYEKMGYIEYLNPKELQEATVEVDSSVTVEPTDTNKKIYEEYVVELGKNWVLHQFEGSQSFYATREIPIYERVIDFYGNMFEFDHVNKVQDPENPDLERYIRFENDPAIGWSLVGSGTEHKYLLYFNSQFPFIHQNFVNLNLGVSYPTYANVEVLDVLTNGQGKTISTDVTFPTGEVKKSSIDIYSRTYKSPSVADAKDKANFGDDPYTATKSRYKDPSMIVNSSIIGLISVFITYIFGIPLGSSPIVPLSCAPTGLKYLKIAILKELSDKYKSSKILSIIYLLVPYGFVVPPTGKSSFIGFDFEFPYTVAELEKTIFLHSNSFITSRSLIVPTTLLS